MTWPAAMDYVLDERLDGDEDERHPLRLELGGR
jgi:hypothetical protein